MKRVRPTTRERWRERGRHASLRYRISLVESDNDILLPGASIIETRYRGTGATWTVLDRDGEPTRVGGHYDPATRPGEEPHDPATCPECLAAAAEEAAERDLPLKSSA